MKTYTILEIAIECAWQLKDTYNGPRAETRWEIADIAQEIINTGLITDKTEDIDEVISAYLTKTGVIA
jgi:hypothetical protein